MSCTRLLALMLCVAGATVLMGCGSSPVAVVNGVKITQSEFNKRLVSTFGRDMLSDMINRQLLAQAAEQAGVTIADEELAKEMAEAKKQFPSEEAFGQWLAGRGMSEADWTEQLRMAMVTRKLALKDVKYTEADLKKFFQEHKDRYALPKRVSISEIVVAEEADAKEVLAKLKANEASFEDLAKLYSTAPYSKEQGGRRPDDMPVDNIPIPAIRSAVETMPVGGVSQPLKTEGGWFIIKLRDRKPARPGSWEQDHERVKNDYELYNAKPIQEILRAAIEKANVTIIDPRFQDLTEQYTAAPQNLPNFGAQGPEGAAAPAPQGAAPAAQPPAAQPPAAPAPGQ